MSERRELPGKFPFTAGFMRPMYRGKLWTMRQYAGFGTAKETNRRYRYLSGRARRSVDGVRFANTDRLRQRRCDALGEVGRVGVAISSLADMEQVFTGIRSTKSHVDDDQCDRRHLIRRSPRGRRETGRAWSKISGTVLTLVERDAGENLFHVRQRRDRDADATDFAEGHRIVAVVAYCVGKSNAIDRPVWPCPRR